MADPIPQDYLNDPLTKREAASIKEDIDSITDGPHDEHAVLIATAMAFHDQAETMGLDWFDALAQVLDNFPDGEIIEDDASEGLGIGGGTRGLLETV